MENTKRFRKGINGRVYDTNMHPKVKRAQDAHYALLQRIADRKVEAALDERGAI
jgi:hypothetical protein